MTAIVRIRAGGAVSRRDLFRTALRRAASELETPSIEINASCLALRGISCRSCEDVCEPRSLRFKPQAGGVFSPQIDVDLCTACGDCVPVCPANAIQIRGGRHHA